MIKFNVPLDIKRKIREYYKTADLWLPQDAKFRYFKFRLPSGSFKQFAIRNRETLRELLIKFTPIDVYYSSSKFINPARIKGRLTKKEELLFLSQDLIIDIDEEENQTFSDIVKIAKNVIRNLGYPHYIIQTSNKGIQIAYENKLDTKILENMDISERMIFYERARKSIVKNLPGIDARITFDLFRVVRMPKTIHHNGNIVDFLDLTNIERLKYIFEDNIILSKSQEAMTSEDFSQRNTDNKPRVDIRGIVTIEDYISNNVLGTKGQYVPLLIYHYPPVSRKDVVSPLLEIKDLMKKYEIPHIYLLKDNEYLYAIGLITMDGKRFNKVINSSSSLLCKKMFRFKQIYMRLSPNIKSCGILSYKTNKKYQLSKSHLPFLMSQGFMIMDKGKYIGKTEARVVKSWKK